MADEPEDVFAELGMLGTISSLVEGGADADAAWTPAEPRGAWCPCLCPKPPPPPSRAAFAIVQIAPVIGDCALTPSVYLGIPQRSYSFTSP